MRVWLVGPAGRRGVHVPASATLGDLEALCGGPVSLDLVGAATTIAAYSIREGSVVHMQHLPSSAEDPLVMTPPSKPITAGVAPRQVAPFPFSPARSRSRSREPAAGRAADEPRRIHDAADDVDRCATCQWEAAACHCPDQRGVRTCKRVVLRRKETGFWDIRVDEHLEVRRGRDGLARGDLIEKVDGIACAQLKHFSELLASCGDCATLNILGCLEETSSPEDGVFGSATSDTASNLSDFVVGNNVFD